MKDVTFTPYEQHLLVDLLNELRTENATIRGLAYAELQRTDSAPVDELLDDYTKAIQFEVAVSIILQKLR